MGGGDLGGSGARFEVASQLDQPGDAGGVAGGMAGTGAFTGWAGLGRPEAQGRLLVGAGDGASPAASVGI